MTETEGKPEFPSNSHKPKPEVEETSIEQRKVVKVVTGTVTKKKKSFVDKFSETFFGDDAKTVVSYVVWDVLIPAAKNTLSEMVSTGIEMLLFGDTKSDRTRRDKGRSYVSYSSIYSKDRDRDRDRGYDRERSRRSRYSFDDIVIPNRAEAEQVLETLVDLVDDYGQATVGDFYDAVGITTDFADQKYGWENLKRAEVRRVRDGYILILPKAYPLD